MPAARGVHLSASCGRKGMEPERACERAGTARRIDPRDQSGQTRLQFFRVPLKDGPEFGFERHTCAVARDGEGALLEATHALGWIMSSGRTSRSNSSAVTKPSFTASSFRVVPFSCAAFATLAALS